MSKPKQIIVVRKDLNMRKGKIAAQAAHASMTVVLNAGRYDRGYNDDNECTGATFLLVMKPDDAMSQWLQGAFTKVCVYVNSEQELFDVYNAALQAKLPAAMIKDSGLTEFNGVPTNTCCAIGPAFPEDLARITGHLPLL